MSDTTTQDAIDECASLAQELRGRLADLATPIGAWDGWTERSILEAALAATDRLRAVVPELAGVHHWTDAQAGDESLRSDRRALAAVRSLTVLVRRAQGLPVAVSRR